LPTAWCIDAVGANSGSKTSWRLPMRDKKSLGALMSCHCSSGGERNLAAERLGLAHNVFTIKADKGLFYEKKYIL
jgi:hypothetical protein